MNTSIRVIKFTTIIAIITVIITLVISLNIKYMWFELKYIPNDFLMAIFSGIFGSTLVVLICEIQKYLLMKKQSEYILYSCMTEVLARFMTMRTSLRLLIENPQDLVNQGLFNEFKQRMEYQFNIFYNVDYTTWCKRQKLFLTTKNFILYSNNTIMKLLDDCAYLDVALYNERIKQLQNNQPDYITSLNSTIKQLLIIYVKRFNEVIEKIEKYIIEIDYRDKYKFKSRIENVKKYHEDYRKSSTVEEFVENNKDYLV